MSKKGRKKHKQSRTKPQPWNKPAPPPLAQYRCLKCQHTWQMLPGVAICPKCEHLYVRWLNYDVDTWPASNS